METKPRDRVGLELGMASSNSLISLLANVTSQAAFQCGEQLFFVGKRHLAGCVPVLQMNKFLVHGDCQ
jgi:hypothetical protein